MGLSYFVKHATFDEKSSIYHKVMKAATAKQVALIAKSKEVKL